MLLNHFPAFGMGCTTTTLSFSSTFTIVKPIQNQVGVALWTGSTGIEIAGAGTSYGPTGFTTVGGVTQTFNFMNSNGSSLLLVANGSGLPIFNTILAPISFAGAPQLWLTCGTTNLSVRITYFINDAFNNQ